MTWNELYPIVKTQAQFAVLRYEEPQRRKDKIQELVCQSLEKYQRDLAAGRSIKKQDYKCFVTQRAKQVDLRSFCKKGYGGTSSIDPLGFYRRRPDSSTSVIEFDDWMTGSVRNKQLVEDNLVFGIDFKEWFSGLTNLQRKILNYLMEGYKASKIAIKLRKSAQVIRLTIGEIRQSFVRFFHIRIKGLSFTT